jgi:hypothetical protein
LIGNQRYRKTKLRAYGIALDVDASPMGPSPNRGEDAILGGASQGQAELALIANVKSGHQQFLLITNRRPSSGA